MLRPMNLLVADLAQRVSFLPTQPLPETAVSIQLAEPRAETRSWTGPHLLELEELNRAEIETILDTAENFVDDTHRRNKRTDLKGKNVVNLFFEPSTRTRTSFGLAARRLGADTFDFTTASSSLSKGETFIDTAKNIEAMGVDVMVVRHASPGTPHLLAQHVECSVINAGDGPHEHPTQGLLDIFTIRRISGRVAGLTIGLVGDIAHSRVARSNIHGLLKLGARVIVCGPSTLVPPEHCPTGRRGRPPPGRYFARTATCSTCCASSSSASGTACSRRSTNMPTCSAWTAPACAAPSRTSCCWRPARSIAASK